MVQSQTIAGITLVALLALAPFASADDHWEDEAEDALENENEGEGTEWEYSLSVSGGEARVEMSRESGESEQSIEFEYNRDDAAIEFSFESETGAGETEAEMEVQFHQLVEYEDDNADGKYNAGETIVSAYSLSEDDEESLTNGAAQASWSAIGQKGTTSDNGVAGTQFWSTANVGGGSLRFDFYVFGADAELGPAAIEATELKLDISIMNFPYQSETSALALLLESESEVEVEDDDDVDRDEEGVLADIGGDRVLNFAWKDFAMVDGVKMDVRTTTLSSESSQEEGEREHEELIVFSYPRGTEIVHDPTMGVGTANSGFLGLPAPGIGLLGLALVGLAAARRRA